MPHIIKKWEIHGGKYIFSNSLIEAWGMKNFGDLTPNEELQPICYSYDKMDHPVWPIEKPPNLLL